VQEWEQVLRGYRALKRILRREAEKFGLNAAEVQILYYLYEGEKNVTNLSKLLGLGKSTVTEALDRLEELGFIKRQRDENDRRVVIVRITEEGIREYERIREAYKLVLSRILEKVNVDCVLEFFKEVEKELSH
jgi:DNA-binding MarR family transcriptional regulator